MAKDKNYPLFKMKRPRTPRNKKIDKPDLGKQGNNRMIDIYKESPVYTENGAEILYQQTIPMRNLSRDATQNKKEIPTV